MGGSQADIYQEAATLLREQAANLRYVANEASDAINTTLNAADVYRGKAVQQLKSTVTDLQQQLQQTLTTERQTACQKLLDLQQQFEKQAEFQKATATDQQQVLAEFTGTTERIQSEPHISQIRDTLRTFEEQRFGQLLMQLAAAVTRPDTVEPASEVVQIRSLKVPFGKVLLDSEDDVEAYLQALRSAMQEQLSQNNRIKV
jgi:hypothetical protein